MGKFTDLTGKRFGKLKVIKRVENNKNGNTCWLCACDCGGSTEARGLNLRSGNSKSCGCMRVKPEGEGAILARQAIADMPRAASRTIARYLLHEYPNVFHSPASANGIVRRVRGLLGNAARKQTRDKSLFREPHRLIDAE